MLAKEECAGGKVVLLRLGLLVGLYPTLNSLVAGLICLSPEFFDSRKDPRVMGPGARSRNISDLWKGGRQPSFW